MIASEDVTVENGAPPAPEGLSATLTPTDHGGTTFTLTWGDPPGQVAPITSATYDVCPESGSGACTAPTTAPPAGPASVTVLGSGMWSVVLWLTNAAGNTNPANAARIVLTVPPKANHGGSGGSKLHLAESLRGRYLHVRVSGPSNRRVKVWFTSRLDGRTVSWRARSVVLKAGRARLAFRLGPRTASLAKIRVDARLDHEPTVTSTLKRR